MQISLNQPEIEEAIQQYLTRQGIALCGKDVSIVFTARRKEAGISADVSIEDTEIPFDDEIQEEKASAQLALVKEIEATKEVEAAKLEPLPDVIVSKEGTSPSLFG